MAESAILKIGSLNGNIWVAMAYICTKFCIVTKIGVLPSIFTSHKMENGGSRHFEVQFNGHDSDKIAHICTTFNTRD